MYDPKTEDRTNQPDSDDESAAGQADDLDRGTGLGASGGGLGKTTGFWNEKPMIDDLKEAGANPDFDRSLEDGKKEEN